MNIKNIDSSHFWAEVPVINNYLTSLLVFTLSFFNQQAFGKMNAGLAAASGAGGALMKLCFDLIAFVEDRAKARNILRLGHAYHHLAYMDFGGKMANARAWEMLRDRNLLTEEEVAFLSKNSGNKPALCLAWAVQAAAAQLKGGKVPPPCVNMLLGDLDALRGAAGKLRSETENPIPYAYMFAINLLLYCWAVSVGLFFAGFLSVYGSVAYVRACRFRHSSAALTPGGAQSSGARGVHFFQPAPDRHPAGGAVRLRDTPHPDPGVPHARPHRPAPAHERVVRAADGARHDQRGRPAARLLRPAARKVRFRLYGQDEAGGEL